MPTSPGSSRGHKGAGADPDEVAAFATDNYAELRRRRDRNAGADLRIPLDLFADARRRRDNQLPQPPQEMTE